MTNKPLTFWQRLKIAKANRLKVKSLGVSFLKELLEPDPKSKLTKIDKIYGYLHYEAGLSLLQISNDIAVNEREVRRINQHLLESLGVKELEQR